MQNPPKKPDHTIKRRKKVKVDRTKSNGYDEVLQTDIDTLLRKNKPASEPDAENPDASPPPPTLPENFTEIEVTVAEISSTGDGLALSDNADHVYVVPFTVPGDKALVKVVRHFPSLSYSLTDFLKVIEPGPQRNDAGIGCQYFGKCSGCQLQMMSYEDQLAHKRRIVEKAYANFSGLIPELVPSIDETFPSPMQYGYRTKLTPHFAAPPGNRRGKVRVAHTEVPPIGFTFKNQRKDMDIEDCPLGTDIVRQGLKSERRRVAENLGKYTKGATLLMRESTTRIPKDGSSRPKTPEKKKDGSPTDSGDVIRVEHDQYVEEKRCVTDNNATSVEYVDDYLFSNKAGAFFQNNNSILSGFTDYIRQLALPKSNAEDPKPIKYLLDAYSGSGLFTITLSPLFKSSLGVDVAGDSITSARENARANNLPNTGFAAADAAVLFKDVPYPADQTLLVIDPPRKGCSDDFLRQLLSYGPRRVAYVSCNVHTQARDVAVMVQGDAEGKVRYEIESIRGFDFFPQTGHVEGVAILNRAVV
ncbi:S-adenosyl-L-methionine-dependent methyltransferase [Aspergillus campestris IBT 28561]|uniref:tRNA (uracil(54)-C(5))-methyltransferase n=1 Tax=Aspergillus campestris (strain IBT 28561) TaxID=1392248 RepID=A0A2I1D192_ASPC2|nr:S-adenosyl-L-methionine-dependent methyltransferase [Aspergillus campestris IBT 28561]PKY03649.1 S-adenosyl-L-methionine-dependent methyltransferase [Aspergillus campestris IBT 28561]